MTQALQRDKRKLLGGDYFYYLFCGDGFTGVCVCQIVQFIVCPFYSNRIVKNSNGSSQATLFAKLSPLSTTSPKTFTENIENVEIVACLLILCTQHRLPHPKRHYPTKVSCYSVNLSSVLGAARLLLKPQTISLLLLLFYSQIKDDI